MTPRCTGISPLFLLFDTEFGCMPKSSAKRRTVSPALFNSAMKASYVTVLITHHLMSIPHKIMWPQRLKPLALAPSPRRYLDTCLLSLLRVDMHVSWNAGI